MSDDETWAAIALTDDELKTLRAGLMIMALRDLGDSDLAEDVVQETLARLLKALASGRLREGSQLGAFARAIARHVIADVRRAREILSLHVDAVGGPIPTTGQTALDALISHEQIAPLRAALAKLSEGDRDILRLTFEEGLSPRAIAAQLQEPPERVRQRKCRALDRLRAIFFGGDTALSRSDASADSDEDGRERASTRRRSST